MDVTDGWFRYKLISSVVETAVVVVLVTVEWEIEERGKRGP